jgi:hypothetical protein
VWKKREKEAVELKSSKSETQLIDFCTWLLTWTHIDRLLARLLMLSKQMIEYGSILLVDALHLVDVLGDLLHSLECLDQMHMFIAVRIGEVLELKQQEWILQDSLNWLYQI